MMRLVVLESPFDTEASSVYARHCLRDCLDRGESPIASHGNKAGHAWIAAADAVIVYTDYGISKKMEDGIAEAQLRCTPIEYRSLATSPKPIEKQEAMEL